MNKKLGKVKVLVVEDSKVAIKAISGYLEDIGVHPLVAESGQAAVELYRRERPDIVLLDIILPDVDGYDVARQIRKLQGKDDWTAIIFLTVMSKDEDLARGIEVGGDDYLMKPVGRVVVQAKVSAMYRLVRMQRALVKVTEQLNEANQELQRLSMTDGLTGIANRRLFDDLLVREWRRCARIGKPMSVVLLDVDYFKKYNDRYGHQAGDDCLKVVAREVAAAAPRAGDLAARYGGEEFVLVLGETDEGGARWVAERICRHVLGLKMMHEDSPHDYVTVSCGVCSVLPSDSLAVDKLVKTADKALYLAKERGRNGVAYLGYGQGS
ncbi:diguanylate cyclase response regulator [Ferrigenium kumadai]|uniref:diguanylate cyclase n=1 Tax=Ferrigenium kumadai TaxID=1682490 RepID=A0AAN1SXQ7_9PROT|nr:diguanylate cyclase [Ferrigenium kumadai]BBI98863.1 diguanylate cyclase response regulator [Ferrigenium kumadai]